jgi:glycosyltransferase involved in cell wall biosynthesis
MNILAISIRIPEDGKKGDQVLSFHRLRYLASSHTVHLICYGSPERDSVAVAKLQSFGIYVQLVEWNKITAGFNLLKCWFNYKLPFQCALFQSSVYRDAVLESISVFKPNAVYAVMIRPLVNLPVNSLPLFIDMVDSMGLNFSRRVAMEHGVRKFAFKSEFRRVSSYEVVAAQRALQSFVVSAVDKNFIGSDKVKALPLGINSGNFNKRPVDESSPVIVFTGNMNYKPNEDAVLWFYNHCWSELKLTVPEIRWVIAGNNPTSNVQALRSDQTITVTGRVSSLAAVISSASVSIAPMQSGSGMQFKILEAMACGVPVVTTSLGLGDIGAKPEQDIILADSAEEFVQAVLTLLGSLDLRQRIGNAGLHYVNLHHTWDALNAEFEQATFSTLIQ